LPCEVLRLASIGAINAHPSLLPAYRGAMPVWWALYDRAEQVGVTVHEMTTAVDEGAILGQVAIAVSAEDALQDVRRRLGEAARPLLRDVLAEIRDTRSIVGTPQPSNGFYRSTPDKELHRLELDWSLPGPELVRRQRIFPGHGTIASAHGRVYASRVEPATPTDHAPGTVLRRRARSIDVAAGDGTAVRVFFGYPARSWAKLALLHLQNRSFKRLTP
jgi:methionyl-tRNA formyltransferase